MIFFIISLSIFSIALLISTIIIVNEENNIHKEEKYNTYFAHFGGIPNISQIRRTCGKIAMGPDYY